MAIRPHAYPRSVRLLDSKAFEPVFEHGQRLHSPHFRLNVLLHPAPALPRLGVVVSKRVDKRAVQRNRLKRLCRETFRQAEALPSADFVFTAKPGAAAQTADVLREQILELFQRSQRLKPRDATGTMPRPSAAPDSPGPES